MQLSAADTRGKLSNVNGPLVSSPCFYSLNFLISAITNVNNLHIFMRLLKKSAKKKLYKIQEPTYLKQTR